MNYCKEYEHLTDKRHYYKSIDIDELLSFFSSLKSGFIFIGGPWCKNCQAIAKQVNYIAKMCNNGYVYNFDPMVKTDLEMVEDIRSCTNLDLKMKFNTLITQIGIKEEDLKVPFFMKIKNGVCVDYYSVELEYEDGLLHLPESKADYYEYFEYKIIKLLS